MVVPDYLTARRAPSVVHHSTGQDSDQRAFARVDVAGDCDLHVYGVDVQSLCPTEDDFGGQSTRSLADLFDRHGAAHSVTHLPQVGQTLFENSRFQSLWEPVILESDVVDSQLKTFAQPPVQLRDSVSKLVVGQIRQH